MVWVWGVGSVCEDGVWGWFEGTMCLWGGQCVWGWGVGMGCGDSVWGQCVRIVCGGGVRTMCLCGGTLWENSVWGQCVSEGTMLEDGVGGGVCPGNSAGNRTGGHYGGNGGGWGVFGRGVLGDNVLIGSGSWLVGLAPRGPGIPAPSLTCRGPSPGSGPVVLLVLPSPGPGYPLPASSVCSPFILQSPPTPTLLQFKSPLQPAESGPPAQPTALGHQ